MTHCSAFSDHTLSTVGKLFLAGVAAWVVGRPSGLKLRGTPEQLLAVVEALKAVRTLKDELMKPDVTVQSIVDLVALKDAAAQRFEQVVGIKFPLA